MNKSEKAWITCSERLPENNEEVLIKFSNGKQTQVIEQASFGSQIMNFMLTTQLFHGCLYLNHLEGKKMIDEKKLIYWIKCNCNPYGKPTLDYDTSIKIMDFIEKQQPKDDEVKV